MQLTKKEQNIGVVISILTIFLLLLFLTIVTLGVDDEILVLLTLGIILIGTTFFGVLVLRNYRKRNKIVEIDLLNIGTQRYILGLFMIFYGMPKLCGTFFDYQLFALDSKLTDVSEFQLAWYYFGKNRWQELFAGLMEFIPGLLIFHRRTYYIAAMILLPVTSQVFILNLFFKIGGITFPAATILLACNCYILYSQKEKIMQLFKTPYFYPDLNLGRKTAKVIKLSRLVIMLLGAALVFKNLKPVFIKSDYQKKYTKLIGAYTIDTVVKNNNPYIPETDSAIYKDLYIEKQSRWNILRRHNNLTDAFILDINTDNDSVYIYINKGGIGDNKDIIDSLTVLKGIYKLDGDNLTIKGTQMEDTLELRFKKQSKIRPKDWFW